MCLVLEGTPRTGPSGSSPWFLYFLVLCPCYPASLKHKGFPRWVWTSWSIQPLLQTSKADEKHFSQSPESVPPSAHPGFCATVHPSSEGLSPLPSDTPEESVFHIPCSSLLWALWKHHFIIHTHYMALENVTWQEAGSCGGLPSKVQVSKCIQLLYISKFYSRHKLWKCS